MADEPNNDDRINRIDPRLLEILVCPRTKTSLLYDESRQELISRSASLAYPIRDGIPIMLEEEARQLDEEEMRAVNRRGGQPVAASVPAYVPAGESWQKVRH